MEEKKTKRKLTAILSADVKGYSHLMQDDEEATVRTITAYREVMSSLIQEHDGRVVDAKGDNLLAEFPSVVDVVRCGIEIQKELKVRNEELPENRKMVFRIGINLGDVIEEEETIYGDGVNIAARLEGLAEGGGICISRTAFDQVKNKLNVGYEYLGAHSVKNIAEPVSVYKVLMEPKYVGKVVGEERPKPKHWRWVTVATVLIVVVGALVIWNFYFRPPPIEPASVEKMAYPLPDKPSIAVLPFDNLSDNPKQEYFADGLTEEIITALSKVPRLFVIARNSSFTYKAKPVKVQQVSEDLGVQYVLEGSVRRAENRVRVTAQLVDALNGRHLWAETYDRELKDIFALQDQISFEVIAALQVKLTEGEQALIVAGRTNNFEAYVKFLQGVEYCKRFNREGNLLARKTAEEIIALDPNYPRGYRLLATTHWISVRLGISKAPKQSMTKAAQLYQKVVAMDPSDAVAHAFLGQVYTMMGQHENGIAEVEKSVAISPNAADAHAMYGFVLHFSGRDNEAIEATQKAIRLNPFPPNWYFAILGQAYCHAGLHKEAIAAYKKALHRQPENLPVRLCLAATYSLSSAEGNARAEIAEVLRLNPNYCVENAARGWPYKNRSNKNRFIDALREAGLPEHPPLPLPDKPSIAVLPFVNMSGDPEQEYFSDGISEEIITALSKTPQLFVIARTSSFKYKGKETDIRTVGRELGVRYVLEGSIRKAGDKVRVTAQLIDAQTNKHIWAERYDREMKDIFAIQDDITMKIVESLHVKLTEGEQARMWGKRSKRLDVFLKILEARWAMAQGTIESHMRLRKVAQELIDMAPENESGYIWLGWYYWLQFSSGISFQESIAKAYELAEKALSMDESNAGTNRLLGSIYLVMKQYKKAIAAGESSIALEPNAAISHMNLGLTLSYAGTPDEAIAQIKQGIRLNPFPPYYYYVSLGRCYIRKGNYEEALAQYKRALEVAPDSWMSHVGITVAYSLLGREQEAHSAAKKFLEIQPFFSVDLYAMMVPYKNPADLEQVVNAMRKVGLN